MFINFNKFNDTIALIKENKIPISRLMSITKDCETITRNSFFSLLLNRNTTFEIPFEVINLLNDNSKLESIISIVTHSKIEEYHFKKIFPKYDYLFFEKEFIINMLMDLTGLNYEICINMASYLNIQDFEGVILPTEKEFINARESNNKGKLLNSWQETIKHQEENKEKINYIQR